MHISTRSRRVGGLLTALAAVLVTFAAAEAIAQITADTRDKRADEFGVRQAELYHNDEGKVYCLLEAPDEEAVRKHHAALGVDCGAVHRVDGIA
jgi:uncharacterized protein DUF4242